MGWVLPFLAFTAAVAATELLLVARLLRTGKIPFNIMQGVIELTWVGVCVLALWKLPLTFFEQAVPLVYLGGLVLGGWLLHRTRLGEIQGTAEGLQIPRSYILFAAALNGALLLLSLVAMARHQTPVDAIPVSDVLLALSPWLLVMIAVALLLQRRWH